MNFISAIKHAAIDYGIRRRAWQKEAILCLGNGSQSCELYWLNIPKEGRMERDAPCRILGPDKTYDLQPEDVTATDWEVI